MRRDAELIQAIYDTAVHPETYPDLLQEISDRVGAHGAMIFDCARVGDKRRVGLQYLSSVYDHDAIVEYTTQYNDAEILDQDRFADLSSTGNEINLIHDKALFSESYPPGPNLAAMLRRGVSDRYGALLSKESWNTDRFAFQFLQGSALPDDEKLAWAEEILSHLAKAMSIGRALSHRRLQEVAMVEFLNTLPIGVGILDNQSRVVFCNQELQRIAQDNAEISIDKDDKLNFHVEDNRSDIEALLVDSEAHGRFGARPRREAVFVPSQHAASGLFIEVCPIQEHPEFDRFASGARLVSVFDGAVGRKIDTETVARFFPISKSEVAVLGLIGQGYANSEIADIRSRSVETVNSQVKSLLRKTSSRNRTELVRVAMGLSNLGSRM